MALALVVGSLSVVEAQELPRFTRLSEGVFVYEHVDPTKRGVTANNLIVATPDGVLVADGQATPENTRELLAAIATVTSQPIRYVVVGSEHGDHRGGDSAFPASATFIAHPFSKANLGRQAAAPARRANAPAVVVPTETVSERRVITLGGTEIDILFLGRSHTGGDLEVYLPRAKVLFMSEVFSRRIFPSMANGFPSEWVAALKRAEQLDADVWVPAHCAIDSPLVFTPDEEHSYRQALERVITEGRRLHDGRVPVDDAASRADFGPFAAWTRAADNAAGAITRVYMELDGQLTGGRD